MIYRSRAFRKLRLGNNVINKTRPRPGCSKRAACRSRRCCLLAVDRRDRQADGRTPCIAGFAPGTPCTMGSFSLGARRRLGHDATNTTQQGHYPAHDDAMTSLAACGPLCANMTSSNINRKYITYRNAARGGSN